MGRIKVVYKLIVLSLLTVFIASCSTGSKHQIVDPYLWLEDVEGDQALKWVDVQNRESLARLESDKRFKKLQSDLEQVLSADDRIPLIRQGQNWLFNFWQDKKNIRGVWRRTTFNEYKKQSPRWTTLLDLDKLSRDENENWVWKGARCLPDDSKCLLLLSRGGKDAVVVREFDTITRSFVKNGFYLPEAKTRVSWIDENTLFVGTDEGEGTLTSSGYPRLVKVWKRGQSIKEAKVIFTARETDVSVMGYSSFSPKGRTMFVDVSPTFYETDLYLVSDSFEIKKLDLPRDISFMEAFHEYGLFQLRSALKWEGRTLAPGTLLAVNLKENTKIDSQAVVLFEPTPRQSLEAVSVSLTHVYLQVISDVQTLIYQVEPWGREKKIALTKLALPLFGAAELSASHSMSRQVFVSYQSFLEPTQLYYYDGKLALVKKDKERFNAKGSVVEQFFARSQDGTQIPYFVIRPKNQERPLPTLLYGYGGFESSMTPFYSSIVGKSWIEPGKVYVVANIRGGGEYGPAWHQAALKENRQKAFDDFIAVAEDLKRREIALTLGIIGGSNGGLLTGAVMLQKPELFDAVVSAVPLLDMLRYHKLLAGASWMAEYGDPDSKKDREFLLKYSPYHNVKKGVKYPEAYFYTSTKDDRVHPGHARKMVARLKELGHPVIYFENTEGGHSAAANNKQRARMEALKYIYLHQKL